MVSRFYGEHRCQIPFSAFAQRSSGTSRNNPTPTLTTPGKSGQSETIGTKNPIPPTGTEPLKAVSKRDEVAPTKTAQGPSKPPKPIGGKRLGAAQIAAFERLPDTGAVPPKDGWKTASNGGKPPVASAASRSVSAKDSIPVSNYYTPLKPKRGPRIAKFAKKHLAELTEQAYQRAKEQKGKLEQEPHVAVATPVQYKVISSRDLTNAKLRIYQDSVNNGLVKCVYVHPKLAGSSGSGKPPRGGKPNPSGGSKPPKTPTDDQSPHVVFHEDETHGGHQVVFHEDEPDGGDFLMFNYPRFHDEDEDIEFPEFHGDPVEHEWVPGEGGFRRINSPKVVALKEPDDQCVESHDRRLMATSIVKKKFPFLDFIGLWNGSHLSPVDAVHVSHWGVHFRTEDIEVELPATLVDELKSWWSHRSRSMEEFLVSVAKCKKLCSELALTAAQQYKATLYAPALAFMESWEEQQNVSRVITGSYLRSDLYTSWLRLKASWKTRRGKQLIAVSVLTVSAAALVAGASVFGLWKLRNGVQLCGSRAIGASVASMWKLQNYSSRVLLSKIRLVGIELNPGPALFRPLVNCVDLPRPKHLKPDAHIGLSDGELRRNLHFKDPKQLKGRQCVYGFDTGHYAPTAFASNQHNEEQALYARVLADTIQPNKDELAMCIDWCKTNHNGLFTDMNKVQSVSFDDYLIRSNASPSVKRILRRTHTQMKPLGIDEDSTLSRSQRAMYTMRSSFVKVENNLYETPAGMKDKAPRLIQGATPEFIVLVGPWIMALQDLMKKRWSINNNLCFTSGVKSEDAAAFIVEGQGAILEDDLGKFDCSIRKPWCDYEVYLCKRFGAPRAVSQLMVANIKTHGRTHHGWVYKCEGTRKSGDPYTSVMNSVINGLSHLYLYCKWTEKTVSEASKTIRMLLQGDDNALRHKEPQKFDWREGMASLGFDSTAIYRSSFDELEFCSNRLYNTSGGYVFGPKPGKVLAKFGYIINPPGGVSRESMMRGVALGLESSCNHIPVLSKVINRVKVLTEGHRAFYQPKFMEHVMKMKRKYHPIIETKLAISEQYYWTEMMQSIFDQKVEGLKLGDKFQTPLANLLFDRDTSGPQLIFNA